MNKGIINFGTWNQIINDQLISDVHFVLLTSSVMCECHIM